MSRFKFYNIARLRFPFYVVFMRFARVSRAATTRRFIIIVDSDFRGAAIRVRSAREEGGQISFYQDCVIVRIARPHVPPLPPFFGLADVQRRGHARLLTMTSPPCDMVTFLFRIVSAIVIMVIRDISQTQRHIRQRRRRCERYKTRTTTDTE